MSQRNRRSRIANFKQPFIVGALGTVVLASACGARSEDTTCKDGCSQAVETSAPEPTAQPTESTTTSNPPPPYGVSDCPTPSPEAGDNCNGFTADLSCSYVSDCTTIRVCTTDGVWVDESPTCNPPEVACPEQAPVLPSSCGGIEVGLRCSYGTDCPREFTCGDDGTWVDESYSCNPPFIEDAGPALPRVDAGGDAGAQSDAGTAIDPADGG